jgi:hypothetical protein
MPTIPISCSDRSSPLLATESSGTQSLAGPGVRKEYSEISYTLRVLMVEIKFSTRVWGSEVSLQEFVIGLEGISINQLNCDGKGHGGFRLGQSV